MSALPVPVTLPALWELYPGWEIHSASCNHGCCGRYEALFAEGTMSITVWRSRLWELAVRLDEITSGGTLPPPDADVRAPDGMARLRRIALARPEIDLPAEPPFTRWRAVIPLPGGGTREVTGNRLGTFCDALETVLGGDAG